MKSKKKNIKYGNVDIPKQDFENAEVVIVRGDGTERSLGKVKDLKKRKK
jgi:hypothetical protein